MLDVVKITSAGGELPGEYVNCTGFGNIAGWSLTVGGEPTRKLRIAIVGDRIRIVSVGMRFIIR